MSEIERYGITGNLDGVPEETAFAYANILEEVFQDMLKIHNEAEENRLDPLAHTLLLMYNLGAVSRALLEAMPVDKPKLDWYRRTLINLASLAQIGIHTLDELEKEHELSEDAPEGMGQDGK